MTYPLMNLYNDAIQNPKINIKDNELKDCSIEQTPWGLPKVASGGFALTYKLNKAGKSWAVRCFHKEVPDLQQRYSKISSFLKSNNSIYFTKFDYIKDGIKVNNNYYPIVKMDWLNGTPLNLYVEKNLNNSLILERLIISLQKCLRELEKMNVAHGDLQHGNILIVNDEIKLIDYYGMFVPNMGFNKSNELGHVNFQHPLRDESYYSQFIDRFSAIVIYLAVRALKEMPSLWQKYDYGENLLFKRDDFLNPESSPLINQLKAISSIAPLVSNFTILCKVRADCIPSLDNFISGKYTISDNEIVYNLQSKAIRRRQYKVLNAAMKDEILNHVGDVIEVVGQITKVHWGKTTFGATYVMLNFGDYRSNCFRIPVWKEGLTLFWKRGVDLNAYSGRWVSVTGLIGNYMNAPQIIFDDSVKINLLSDANKAQELFKETSYSVISNQSNHIKSNSEILKKISPDGVKDTIIKTNITSSNRNVQIIHKTKNQAVLEQIQQQNQIPRNVMPSRNNSVTNTSQQNINNHSDQNVKNYNANASRRSFISSIIKRVSLLLKR